MNKPGSLLAQDYPMYFKHASKSGHSSPWYCPGSIQAFNPRVIIPIENLVLITLPFWKKKGAEKYGYTLYYQNLASEAASSPWFVLFTAVDMAFSDHWIEHRKRYTIDFKC